MEGNKARSHALLIFGAPCSGKTTFSEKFAKRFGLAYYDLDKLVEQGGFTREQILIILAEIAKTKQTVVIENGLRTEDERGEIRSVFRDAGYAPSLVWIQTDISTIRARLKTRYKSVSKAKEVYDSAVKEIEAPSDNERPIILSGKHTFETQTKHVISGLADIKNNK